MNTKNKRIALITVGLVICAAVAAIILYLQPPCLILRLTGFYCPACGTQRMIISLLHGEPAAAFSYNPFMFCVLPVICFYFICESLRCVNKKPMLCKSRGFSVILCIIVALAIIFAVLRNLPQFAFLAPG